MKNVLCFGDSNTYGYDPAGMRDGTAVRYARDVRWCGVAQRDLGEGWHVIEEGLNGRTTVRDDMCHLDTNLNGIRALPMLLEAHKPLDAIVIMLGTNDCKTVFNVTASDIARGAMALIRAVRAFPWTDAAPCPRILLMAPIKIKPQIADVYMTDFDEHSVEASEHFGEYYYIQPSAPDSSPPDVPESVGMRPLHNHTETESFLQYLSCCFFYIIVARVFNISAYAYAPRGFDTFLLYRFRFALLAFAFCL